MPYTIGNFLQRQFSTTAAILRSSAVILAVGVAVGGGIRGYGVAETNPANLANMNKTHEAVNILAKETTSGCVSAGTASGCVMVIVGATQNGFLFSHTGGLIIGSFAAPQMVLSGGLLRIGGGVYPTAGEELSVVGDMSGSTLRVDAFGAHLNKLSCYKAGGQLGYIALTASGTIAMPFTCQ